MAGKLVGSYTNEELDPVRKALRNLGYGEQVAGSAYLNGPTAGTMAAEQVKTFDQGVRDRYRGLGAAAANRQAYNIDFSEANADRAKGLAARGQQAGALGMMRQAAMGNAPSRAEIMGAQAGGQSLDAALGAGAGARPGGMAAAQMAAQRSQGVVQQGAIAGGMGARSQEMGAAIGSYGKGATTMRTGDYAQQAISQQQAEAQARAEMEQRQLNQTGQMGYEQMGINEEQRQIDEQLRRMNIEATARSSDAATAQAALGRNRADAIAAGQASAAVVTMGAGAAAGGAAAAAKAKTGSDERMKQGAHMLSDARTKVSGAIDDVANRNNDTADEDGESVPSESKPKVAHKPAFEGTARSLVPTGKVGQTNAMTPGSVVTYTKNHGGDSAPGKPAPEKHAEAAKPAGYFAQLASQLRSMVSDESAKASPRSLATASAARKATPGAVTEGNINHYGRAEVSNKDGSTSTVRSMSFNDGPGREVLIPTAYDGAVHSEDEAIANYRKTGQHMGIFKTPDAATAHAEKIHNEYEAGKYRDGPAHVIEQREPKMATTSDENAKRDIHGGDEMTNALADGLKPYEYEYKPGFAEHEGQQQGEKNVGPMAQDMASNPITGQAVSEGEGGLLQIDMKKATKLSLAAAGHNAMKIRELEARMKGGR